MLDPFAGGSVRGIVASQLGRAYVGIELRAEQVAANQAQAALGAGSAPQWITGDSRDIDERINRIIAMVRAKVEHPFRIIKRQFGHVKTRYRGLAKNRAQMFTLFALGNLFLVRRRLMA